MSLCRQKEQKGYSCCSLVWFCWWLGFFAKDICLATLYQYQTTRKEVHEQIQCKILLSFADMLVFLWLYTR